MGEGLKVANRKPAELLADLGYEDVVIFENFSYDDALIGVTEDNRAVYDFNKMVAWLVETEGMTDEEAIEWIEYNTIRALPYAGDAAPIIMYPIADEAVEVVHGRWEQVQTWATKAKYRCSVCGREIMSARTVNIEKYPYCHCGADMRERRTDV